MSLRCGIVEVYSDYRSIIHFETLMVLGEIDMDYALNNMSVQR
jgi:hypothetical protein